MSPATASAPVNLCRRHLTASQKSTIAVEALPMFEAEAKERQKTLNNSFEEKIPQAREPQARDKAAQAVGVNPRYVSDAKRIEEESTSLLAALGNPPQDAEAKERMFPRRLIHLCGVVSRQFNGVTMFWRIPLPTRRGHDGYGPLAAAGQKECEPPLGLPWMTVHFPSELMHDISLIAERPIPSPKLFLLPR